MSACKADSAVEACEAASAVEACKASAEIVEARCYHPDALAMVVVSSSEWDFPLLSAATGSGWTAVSLPIAASISDHNGGGKLCAVPSPVFWGCVEADDALFKPNLSLSHEVLGMRATSEMMQARQL